MTGSAHQAAIDQAHLLAAYLYDTPAQALDLDFIRRHLDALKEFAQAAKTETAIHIQAGERTLPDEAGARPALM